MLLVMPLEIRENKTLLNKIYLLKKCKNIPNIREFPFKLIFTILIFTNHFTTSRSSHPEVFYKNGVLKNFAKFTEKHLS